jgi:hypothetical protein
MKKSNSILKLSIQKILKSKIFKLTQWQEYMLFSKFKLGQIDEKDYNENYKKTLIVLIYPQFNQKIQLFEFYESINNIKVLKDFKTLKHIIYLLRKNYREKLIALKQLTNVFPEKVKYYSNEYEIDR